MKGNKDEKDGRTNKQMTEKGERIKGNEEGKD